MTDVLLQTKLYIPRLRPSLIPRPHLIEKLNKGLHRKLTLLSAPAGYGKTTLVTEWIARGERPYVWVSLDEDDNNLPRFFTYVAAALQQIEGVGKTIQGLLQATQPVPLKQLATALVNDCTSVTTSFVLVLDDYHVITETAVHEAVAFLLDNLPPQLHLVITSRTDPFFPVARLRARSQITELRTADLRFTVQETADFLQQVMGLNLSAGQVSALEAYTEGWIAGLQMAALSMQGLKNEAAITAFVADFTGSHRYIFDYLTDEVLQQQPSDTRSFLLQTSLLNRLSGALCAAVTGQKNSKAILRSLEDANLFLFPLDEKREWYRYHHLFVDLLRQRLRREQADLVPELHRRAATWYEQNGLLTEAVHHALIVEDTTYAAHLVEKMTQTMFQGEASRISGLLERLPPAEIHSRPQLSIFTAWMFLLKGQFSRVSELMHNLEGILPTISSPAETAVLTGHIAAIRAFLNRNDGDLPRAIALSEQARVQLPESEDNVLLRALNLINLGVACALNGDLEPALDTLFEAKTVGQRAGITVIALGAVYEIAQLYLAQGQLRKAVQVSEEAVTLVDQLGWQLSPTAGLAYVGLGDLLREQNELEAATRYLMRGIERGQQGARQRIVLVGYVALARVRMAQGDLAGANDALQVAEQIWQQGNVGRFWISPLVTAYRTRLWLAQEDIALAIARIREQGLVAAEVDTIPLRFVDEVEHLAWARVLLAQDNPDAAVRLLHRLLAAAEEARRTGSVLEIQILLALAHQGQGDLNLALAMLERALLLAEPEGYVRIFVDEGAPLARLLLALSQRPTAVNQSYLDKLLAEFNLDTSQLQPAHPEQALIEPLSQRELEVLAWLADGATNQQIADALIISYATVKKHVSNIIGKLGVQNRSSAVARARELGLIS